WRWMFVCYALPGLVWAVWFYWWYRNSPGEYRSVETKGPRLAIDNGERAPAENLGVPWSVLFTNRAMLALCGQQFCRASAATFFASWFATYMKETRGVSLVQAGLLNSIPLWSMMVGSFAGGFTSDLVFRLTGSLNAARRGIAIFSVLSCAAVAST